MRGGEARDSRGLDGDLPCDPGVSSKCLPLPPHLVCGQQVGLVQVMLPGATQRAPPLTLSGGSRLVWPRSCCQVPLSAPPPPHLVCGQQVGLVQVMLPGATQRRHLGGRCADAGQHAAPELIEPGG